MSMPWIDALAAVTLVNAISLSGAVFLAGGRARLERNLHLIVAFAVGALFGDAFIHLLPEAFRSGPDPLASALPVLAGFFVFHALDGMVQAHVPPGAAASRRMRSIVAMNLAGDGLHNFVDGLLIGASFLAGLPIGLSTTLAVILHEIPQEIGDFGILVHAGQPPRKALALNLLSSLTATLGTALSLALGSRLGGYARMMLPFTAGGFLYLGGSVLLPSLGHSRGLRDFFLDWLAMAAGVGVMAALAVLE
jgi:zinc and cadmium transporter